MARVKSGTRYGSGKNKNRLGNWSKEVWTLPGGKRADTDLSPEETAAREVEEETGGAIQKEWAQLLLTNTMCTTTSYEGGAEAIIGARIRLQDRRTKLPPYIVLATSIDAYGEALGHGDPFLACALSELRCCGVDELRDLPLDTLRQVAGDTASVGKPLFVKICPKSIHMVGKRA